MALVRRTVGPGRCGVDEGLKVPICLFTDMPWPLQLMETQNRSTSLTATSLGRTKSEVLLR
jgi:hypothetical protein